MPVTANVQFYLAEYGGLTKREAMYDYQGLAAALVKYHEDFRPDFQARPLAPAGVFALLGLQFVDWPGRGLDESTPWQYLEAEYMGADEYDALIANPDGYFRRTLLPRFGSTFALWQVSVRSVIWSKQLLCLTTYYRLVTRPRRGCAEAG